LKASYNMRYLIPDLYRSTGEIFFGYKVRGHQECSTQGKK